MGFLFFAFYVQFLFSKFFTKKIVAFNIIILYGKKKKDSDEGVTTQLSQNLEKIIILKKEFKTNVKSQTMLCPSLN